MTENDAGAFVEGWIAAWNRRHLEAVEICQSLQVF